MDAASRQVFEDLTRNPVAALVLQSHRGLAASRLLRESHPLDWPQEFQQWLAVGYQRAELLTLIKT
jgi:hypothetical protein